jgi:hypothetical protein
VLLLLGRLLFTGSLSCHRWEVAPVPQQQTRGHRAGTSRKCGPKKRPTLEAAQGPILAEAELPALQLSAEATSSVVARFVTRWAMQHAPDAVGGKSIREHPSANPTIRAIAISDIAAKPEEPPGLNSSAADLPPRRCSLEAAAMPQQLGTDCDGSDSAFAEKVRAQPFSTTPWITGRARGGGNGRPAAFLTP